MAPEIQILAVGIMMFCPFHAAWVQPRYQGKSMVRLYKSSY